MTVKNLGNESEDKKTYRRPEIKHFGSIVDMTELDGNVGDDGDILQGTAFN
jgi:hypothetical protein